MYDLEHIKKIQEEYAVFEKDIISRCKFSANAEYGYADYRNKIVQDYSSVGINISEDHIWCDFVCRNNGYDTFGMRLEVEEVQMCMEDFEKHINSKFAFQIRKRELEKRRQQSAIENQERAELERITRKYK